MSIGTLYIIIALCMLVGAITIGFFAYYSLKKKKFDLVQRKLIEETADDVHNAIQYIKRTNY